MIKQKADECPLYNGKGTRVYVAPRIAGEPIFDIWQCENGHSYPVNGAPECSTGSEVIDDTSRAPLV